VVFAIPYESEFTLVGTTDEAWQGAPARAEIDQGEIDYLLATVARYFEKPVAQSDIIWTYSGIRPLYDDHATSASAVTRDYVLDLDGDESRAPLLSVFGGKITTYRKLAEHALGKLAPFFAGSDRPWTAGAILPGGDMPSGDFAAYVESLRKHYPALEPKLLARLARAYGTRTKRLLGDAQSMQDLGECFGGNLYAREIDYLIDQEWASAAQDVLYRRSKLGLHLPMEAEQSIANYMAQRLNRAD
jgi:glycerol-3-phosphate dehydrogenase